MEFWDDLKEKVGDGARAVGKGAEKVTDMAKIKYARTIRQGKLEKTFESIGSFRYDEYKCGIDNSEVINKLLVDADNLNDEIAELRSRLDEARGKRCENCGARISKNSAYCPGCGAKQTPTDDNAAE